LNLLRGVAWVFAAGAAVIGTLRGADPVAAHVVIVANADDADSVRIARHYADVRGVPVENIIAVGMPLTETISWSEFVSRVWQPVQDELIRRDWIDGIPMSLLDRIGRRKVAIGGHKIAYLVICRGVPLRINHDPALYRPHPPLTDNPFFQTNAAAVDSELSLLAVNDSPINAFLVNPLYRNDHPGFAELSKVIKVSRLDGPTAADAYGLVDRAMTAEKDGLIGRAYVDLGGIHPDGEAWLRSTLEQVRELGYDLDVDESPATMPSTARFDLPALYFGWYASSINGPFTLPGFRFPPGAVAVHIHSDSAATMRSNDVGWTGPLVARGVTATVGNVFEPYLQLLHRPDLLLRALARGDRFGDAAYYSAPVLSWQAIAVGDPLYRPFAVSLPAQKRALAKLAPALAGYVILREMHRLDAAGKSAEAIAIAREAQKRRPSLAVGYELARRDEKTGDLPKAVDDLRFAGALKNLSVEEWGLAHEAARLLHRAGSVRDAVRLYRTLLRDPARPKDVRMAWLKDARDAAVAAGESDQSTAWSSELESRPMAPKK
jgi:uncharacterized protein (TIGR03790 family)